jgi:nucleoside-diphosphate-sugar epimerase
MNLFKKPKVAIFGSSGFIGKNLLSLFNTTFDIVVYLRNPINENYGQLFKGVNFYINQINTDNLVRFFQLEKPDFIINLISYVSADRNQQNFYEILDSNVQIVEIILKSLVLSKIIIKNFIQFGSTEEYGNQTAPFKEDMLPITNSLYGLSKTMATNLVQMYSKENNIPSMILRPSNLFGKFQLKEKIIPYIVASIKKEEKFQISNLEKLREFYSIIDLMHTLKIIMFSPERSYGDIFNIGYGKGITILELIKLIEKETGKKANFSIDTKKSRINEPKEHYVSIEKFKKTYLFTPYESNLESRLSQFIRSFDN